MKAKIREDLREFVFTTDNEFELDNNGEYEYRWLNEHQFQILINGNWQNMDSIDFDFM
jgi:hypothetical protein